MGKQQRSFDNTYIIRHRSQLIKMRRMTIKTERFSSKKKKKNSKKMSIHKFDVSECGVENKTKNKLQIATRQKIVHRVLTLRSNLNDGSAVNC